jgi:hypothetical protein
MRIKCENCGMIYDVFIEEKDLAISCLVLLSIELSVAFIFIVSYLIESSL